MLEIRGIENRVRQLERELEDRGELTSQAKELILSLRATVALLKSQYRILSKQEGQ